MQHIHKKTGYVFDIGKYVDVDGEHTYDTTIITLWGCDDEPIKLVGYYQGDYNEEDTDYFIDEWLTERAKTYLFNEQALAALWYLDAYLTTNRDVMEQGEIIKLTNIISWFKLLTTK